MMGITVTSRWRVLMMLFLVTLWGCGSKAQRFNLSSVADDDGVVFSSSQAEAAISEMRQAKANTTCHLTIEGGSNKTEMNAYGTSIARAELVCTGQILSVAVHPVLARFASKFRGVKVAKIPNMRDLKRAEETATAEKLTCFSRSGVFVFFCGNDTDLPIIELVRLRVVNLKSQQLENLENPSVDFLEAIEVTSTAIGASLGFENTVLEFGYNMVRLIEPIVSQVQFSLFTSFELMDVQGGLINATMGVTGGGVLSFEATQFTHNQGMMNAGAFTLVFGQARFKDCLFERNWARTVDDVTRGQTPLQMYRSGLGGAVLGHLYFRGDKTIQLQTAAIFINCAFIDNKAYEGGAIAMVGVNTTITNCTFKGNSAIQNGYDVYSTRGGTLDINDSDITVASPTVAWERTNGSQCLRGEFFGELEGTCRKCPGSTYSLVTPAPTACSPCPPNARCPGGDAIVANKGFFRVSNASDKVISCPRAGACLAGECVEGQEGLVCGSCSEGYAPSTIFKCVRCTSKVGAVVVFVASVLVLLVFTGIAIQLTLTSNKDDAVESASNSSAHTAGDVVKLLALFFQYTSIIGSLPVPWPPSLLALITASDWMFASSVGQTLAWVKSPLECALKGLRVPSAVLKQLVYLLMPAVVALILVLFFVSVYSCCCRSKKHTLRLTVVLMVSAFFTFPIVLRAAFSFFGCYSVVDPTVPHSLWWVQDMGQACYRGAHRVWALAVGLPFLIACCSAPLVLGYWLWRNSARMGDPAFCERYGHIYRLYRAHAYWYEPVILIQTIVLVAITVFASQLGNYVAVILAGLHIALALQLLQLVRPYAALLLHRLHVASLCCLLLNVFVALLMFDQSARASSGAFEVAQAAAAAFSLVMSVCFIVVSCACICFYFIRGPGREHVNTLFARWCGKPSNNAGGRRWVAV